MPSQVEQKEKDGSVGRIRLDLVEDWKCKDVRAWLRWNQMNDELISIFTGNHIDGKALADLSVEDIQEMIPSLGLRKKLTKVLDNGNIQKYCHQTTGSDCAADEKKRGKNRASDRICTADTPVGAQPAANQAVKRRIEGLLSHDNPFCGLLNEGRIIWLANKECTCNHVKQIVRATEEAYGRYVHINTGTHGDTSGYIVDPDHPYDDVQHVVEDFSLAWECELVSVHVVSSLSGAIYPPHKDAIDAWCFSEQRYEERRRIASQQAVACAGKVVKAHKTYHQSGGAIQLQDTQVGLIQSIKKCATKRENVRPAPEQLKVGESSKNAVREAQNAVHANFGGCTFEQFDGGISIQASNIGEIRRT